MKKLIFLALMSGFLPVFIAALPPLPAEPSTPTNAEISMKVEGQAPEGEEPVKIEVEATKAQPAELGLRPEEMAGLKPTTEEVPASETETAPPPEDVGEATEYLGGEAAAAEAEAEAAGTTPEPTTGEAETDQELAIGLGAGIGGAALLGLGTMGTAALRRKKQAEAAIKEAAKPAETPAAEGEGGEGVKKPALTRMPTAAEQPGAAERPLSDAETAGINEAITTSKEAIDLVKSFMPDEVGEAGSEAQKAYLSTIEKIDKNKDLPEREKLAEKLQALDLYRTQIVAVDPSAGDLLKSSADSINNALKTIGRLPTEKGPTPSAAPAPAEPEVPSKTEAAAPPAKTTTPPQPEKPFVATLTDTELKIAQELERPAPLLLKPTTFNESPADRLLRSALYKEATLQGKSLSHEIETLKALAAPNDEQRARLVEAQTEYRAMNDVQSQLATRTSGLGEAATSLERVDAMRALLEVVPRTATGGRDKAIDAMKAALSRVETREAAKKPAWYKRLFSNPLKVTDSTLDSKLRKDIADAASAERERLLKQAQEASSKRERAQAAEAYEKVTILGNLIRNLQRQRNKLGQTPQTLEERLAMQNVVERLQQTAKLNREKKALQELSGTLTRPGQAAATPATPKPQAKTQPPKAEPKSEAEEILGEFGAERAKKKAEIPMAIEEVRTKTVPAAEKPAAATPPPLPPPLSEQSLKELEESYAREKAQAAEAAKGTTEAFSSGERFLMVSPGLNTPEARAKTMADLKAQQEKARKTGQELSKQDQKRLALLQEIQEKEKVMAEAPKPSFTTEEQQLRQKVGAQQREIERKALEDKLAKAKPLTADEQAKLKFLTTIYSKEQEAAATKERLARAAELEQVIGKRTAPEKPAQTPSAAAPTPQESAVTGIGKAAFLKRQQAIAPTIRTIARQIGTTARQVGEKPIKSTRSIKK